MTGWGQQLPGAVDHARYQRDLAAWQARVRSLALDYSPYASALNPYPFLVREEALAEMIAFQHSLRRALRAIVEHYPRDARLREIVSLTAAEESFLSEWWGRPFALGSHRPDFLHLPDGGFQITEINARFALNGYLISWLLSEASAGFFEGFRPVPQMAALLPALRERLLGEGPVGLWKDSEGGWDIHLLHAWWNGRCRFRARGESGTRYASLVLELHQPEICALSTSEQAELLAHARVLNDPRTVFVLHDKRLLALLSTSDVLADYLPGEDWQRLRRHTVPTYVAGRSPEIKRLAARANTGWLAKPPGLGKGKGILLAHRLALAEWRDALEKLPPDWILQPFIEQATFPILTERAGETATVPMKVSGVLPALDEQVFGPGIYRASPEDIVAVSRGGTILTPVLEGGR